MSAANKFPLLSTLLEAEWDHDPFRDGGPEAPTDPELTRRLDRIHKLVEEFAKQIHTETYSLATAYYNLEDGADLEKVDPDLAHAVNLSYEMVKAFEAAR